MSDASTPPTPCTTSVSTWDRASVSFSVKASQGKGQGQDLLASERRGDEVGGDHEGQERRARVLRDACVPEQERLHGKQAARLMWQAAR